MNSFQFTPAGVEPLLDEESKLASGQQTQDGLPSFAPAVIRTSEVRALAPQRPATIAPPPPAFKTQNVATLMRARLREVEKEIKRLRALEKERDELVRMLAAATEKKTKTHVSALKRVI